MDNEKLVNLLISLGNSASVAQKNCNDANMSRACSQLTDIVVESLSQAHTLLQQELNWKTSKKRLVSVSDFTDNQTGASPPAVSNHYTVKTKPEEFVQTQERQTPQ